MIGSQLGEHSAFSIEAIAWIPTVDNGRRKRAQCWVGRQDVFEAEVFRVLGRECVSAVSCCVLQFGVLLADLHRMGPTPRVSSVYASFYKFRAAQSKLQAFSSNRKPDHGRGLCHSAIACNLYFKARCHVHSIQLFYTLPVTYTTGLVLRNACIGSLINMPYS